MTFSRLLSLRQGLSRIALLAIVIILVIGIYLYLRPLPAVQPTPGPSLKISPSNFSLPWPAYGQGAISEASFGLLDKHGDQKAVPMASTAKVITALAIVKQKPLAKGEAGPTITLTSDDVGFFNNYYSQGGSVVKVSAGEQISEYQALQAMLLPSANNLADSLARWAFGSIPAYVDYANSMLKAMGLSQTHVVDASGFSPDSVSTAEELVSLGEKLLKNQVLAEVVSQTSADIPVAGRVTNLNWLLGSDDVVGIKTGSTEQAGGCFLFAAKRQVLGQPMTFVGAIMGAPNRNQAIADGRTILRSVNDGFVTATVASKGQAVGQYISPWGASDTITLADDFKITTWRGWNSDTRASAREIKAPLKSGVQIGELNVTLGRHSASAPLVLQNGLSSPPWTWRLFR